MKDIAHDETDAIIKALEKRITKEYRQAEQEIQARLDDYLKRFKIKDDTWQRWVKEGTKTKSQYNDWRISQMAMGLRWELQKQDIARELTNVNELAKRVVYDTMPSVYAENINYITFDIEHKSLIDTRFHGVNRDTAAGILKERKLYPDPGKEAVRKISEGLEMRWNKQQIQSVMLQSILQGDSIPRIATRLAKTVGEKDRKAAIRNARTMTTGVENAARIDGLERAKSMGIDVQKQWLATIDDRTRHEHRILDGQTRDSDEPFEVDGYEIMFPGDPDCKEPSMIYNCRCSLISSIKNFERDLSDVSQRRSKLGEMSYDEWKEAKAISQDILHQDKVAATMKGVYIAKYKGYIDW